MDKITTLNFSSFIFVEVEEFVHLDIFSCSSLKLTRATHTIIRVSVLVTPSLNPIETCSILPRSVERRSLCMSKLSTQCIETSEEKKKGKMKELPLELPGDSKNLCIIPLFFSRKTLYSL